MSQQLGQLSGSSQARYIGRKPPANPIATKVVVMPQCMSDLERRGPAGPNSQALPLEFSGSAYSAMESPVLLPPTPWPVASGSMDGELAQLPTPEQAHNVSSVWEEIQLEVTEMVNKEPEAGGLLHQGVTIHDSLQSSLAFVLSNKLASSTLSPAHLIRLITNAYEADARLSVATAADLRAAKERDVACETFVKALLFFKGFQAVQAYRVANWMWRKGRRDVAFDLQGRIAKVFNVDIHPAAMLGNGILLDHATGIVIGQTSVIGNNVSMLHRVILGGSGFEVGRRHPTIEDGVLLGAGVNVFGPVTVGANSKVGAGSLVVENIPPSCVAVGVPAKVIKKLDEGSTALANMDQGVEFILDYEI